MPKIFEPFDNSVYLQWIDTISEEASDELNEWEINFVANIQQRLISGLTLTENQHKKLEQIYTEKTS